MTYTVSSGTLNPTQLNSFDDSDPVDMHVKSCTSAIVRDFQTCDVWLANPGIHRCVCRMLVARWHLNLWAALQANLPTLHVSTRRRSRQGRCRRCYRQMSRSVWLNHVVGHLLRLIHRLTVRQISLKSPRLPSELASAPPTTTLAPVFQSSSMSVLFLKRFHMLLLN